VTSQTTGLRGGKFPRVTQKAARLRLKEIRRLLMRTKIHEI